MEPPADEPRLHAGLLHHLLQVDGEGESDASGARLEGEAVPHDARVAHEPRHQLGQEEAVGALGDLGGAGDDLARVSDLIHLHHAVHVVALDLPWDGGEGHEVVGDHDDLVGVEGVGQGEVEGAARRRAVHAVGVPERVGAGGGDDGDVHVHLAVLDGLPAPAVGAQDAQAAHLARRCSNRRAARSWSPRCGGRRPSPCAG